MVFFGKLTAAAVSLCLCVFLLRSRFFIAEAARWKQIACYGGCWILLAAARLLGNYALILALAAMLVAGFLCWYLYQATPLKALSTGALFGVLQLAAAGVGMFFQRFFPDMGAECVLLPEMTALYALTALASAFSQQWRAVPMPLLALVPVWLVCVILCEEMIRRRGDMGISILLFFAYLWMLYAGIHLMQVRSRMEAKILSLMEARQKAHHYVLQEEYYRQLQDKQAETRALWHDLNKYLRAAKAETPDAPSLAQLKDMLSSATQIVDVGNHVLNVLLNEYDQSSKAAGIDLRMKVQVPPELPVTPADLYILIGNTMDNALEACGELPPDQRVIDLTLRTHNDVLYYKLTNPYVRLSENPAPDHTHGYGLQNVRRCVQKYGGSVEIWQEDGFFTVSAHLNLE